MRTKPHVLALAFVCMVCLPALAAAAPAAGASDAPASDAQEGKPHAVVPMSSGAYVVITTVSSRGASGELFGISFI